MNAQAVDLSRVTERYQKERISKILKNVKIGLAVAAAFSAIYLFNALRDRNSGSDTTLAVAKALPTEAEKLEAMFKYLVNHPFVAAPLLGIGAIAWLNGGFGGLF